jgi:hypothetical protein
VYERIEITAFDFPGSGGSAGALLVMSALSTEADRFRMFVSSTSANNHGHAVE